MFKASISPLKTSHTHWYVVVVVVTIAAAVVLGGGGGGFVLFGLVWFSFLCLFGYLSFPLPEL